jgi:DNA-directed RNA polymerase specialized sigma24 family protein
MTLEEIAKELGCSHQAVWYAQNTALKKFKHRLELLGITYEDFELYLQHNNLKGD